MKIFLNYGSGLELINHFILLKIDHYCRECGIQNLEVVLFPSDPKSETMAHARYGQLRWVHVASFTEPTKPCELSVGVGSYVASMGNLLSFADRNISSDHFYGGLATWEVITRFAQFASWIESEGGVYISEPLTDILSVLVREVSFRSPNTSVIFYHSPRLFPLPGRRPFVLSTGKDETDLILPVPRSTQEAELSELALKHTVKCLEEGATSHSIYADLGARVSTNSSLRFQKRGFTVLYPLHYFPESSSLGSGLGCWNNLWIIEMISRSIPSRVELIVKPHFMKDDVQSDVLKVVSRLPGVRIIPAEAKLTNALEITDCLITWSSSAGMEAIFRNINVIYFSNFSIYNKIDGCFHFDPTKLSITQLTEILSYFMMDQQRPADFICQRGVDRKESLMVELRKQSDYSYFINEDERFPFSFRIADAVVASAFSR